MSSIYILICCALSAVALALMPRRADARHHSLPPEDLAAPDWRLRRAKRSSGRRRCPRPARRPSIGSAVGPWAESVIEFASGRRFIADMPQLASGATITRGHP